MYEVILVFMLYQRALCTVHCVLYCNTSERKKRKKKKKIVIRSYVKEEIKRKKNAKPNIVL